MQKYTNIPACNENLLVPWAGKGSFDERDERPGRGGQAVVSGPALECQQNTFVLSDISLLGQGKQSVKNTGCVK